MNKFLEFVVVALTIFVAMLTVIVISDAIKDHFCVVSGSVPVEGRCLEVGLLPMPRE